jgi:hypothetical protein
LGFIWGREVEFFPRRKMETSLADSPPISPPMVESSLVDVVEDENMEPMVIVHPGVIEDMDVKPPAPSTPLPPASTINSDANPTIRKAFLLKLDADPVFSFI